MYKGILILVLTGLSFVVAVFSLPTVAKAYDHYTLVDSWKTRSGVTCLYENKRGDQVTTSVNKGRSCPRYHKE